jgi:hypothetical protein
VHAQMIMNGGLVNIPPHEYKDLDAGITECRKLKCRIWRSDMRHNVHTKFLEFLSSHSLVIKYIQLYIAS